MKVHLSEIVELRGDAWTDHRFENLKKQNPEGRVAVIDEKQQVFVVSIKDLEKLAE